MHEVPDQCGVTRNQPDRYVLRVMNPKRCFTYREPLQGSAQCTRNSAQCGETCNQPDRYVLRAMSPKRCFTHKEPRRGSILITPPRNGEAMKRWGSALHAPSTLKGLNVSLSDKIPYLCPALPKPWTILRYVDPDHRYIPG